MDSTSLGGGVPADVVLALSLETWDDMVRREFVRPPDRMTRHLQQSGRVKDLIIANPWRSVASVPRRRFGPDRDTDLGDARGTLVRPLRVRRADSRNLERVERSYRLYTRLLRLTARRRGLRAPRLITFSPIVAGFGDLTGFSSVTYVGRDDWAAADRHAEDKHIFLEAYERIRRRGVRVSAVSQVLLDRLAPTGVGIVTPNGVDPDTWTALPEAAPETIDAGGPVIIYTGTVDDRTSIDRMASISTAIPDAVLLLVGPCDPGTRDAIRSTVPSSRFTGPVDQKRLASLVAAADLCVVPHVRSALTEAMSPLKVYEYVAAGKRVVATDLKPMHDIDPHVHLVADAEDFGTAVRRALASATASETERLDFIARNTWEARCDRILDLALA